MSKKQTMMFALTIGFCVVVGMNHAIATGPEADPVVSIPIANDSAAINHRQTSSVPSGTAETTAIAAPQATTFVPRFYRPDTGELIWGRHIHYEDPGNTVFSLARELVTLPSQPAGSRPEVLLFNFALFDPPEGIAVGTPRRLMRESIDMIGLQLYVNYSDANIDPNLPCTPGSNPNAPTDNCYYNPTFFISIDGDDENTQTTPPVPWTGFSTQFVSATRGAFGALNASSARQDYLYVTAGLGYGLADLDPDPTHIALAVEAQTDRLMWLDPQLGRWRNIATEICPVIPVGMPGFPRVPLSATQGNSSGVVFADFDGDGWNDLYVGKTGDNYLGAPNVLLMNNGIGCFADETATRIPNEPSKATNDVAAVDLDMDGDIDLVVADRCRRAGICGAESEDYVLINDGTGHFTIVLLSLGTFSDSRSVAVGDMNQDGWPEIVLGNAGSDGLSNVLIIPTADDHPMEIFFNDGAIGGAINSFTDGVTGVFGAGTLELFTTTPLTQQVLLTDIFTPLANLPVGAPPEMRFEPDGWLDLVIVNHRDILKHVTSFFTGSRVNILTNKANWTSSAAKLEVGSAIAAHWMKTVALADFTNNGRLDFFIGRGNRFNGVISDIQQNLGSSASPGASNPWNFNGSFVSQKSYDVLPGTEHGYGLDFGDIDGDGYLDALQTSRSYDYCVTGIYHPTIRTEHTELAQPALGSGVTGNDRGRLLPRGMEDGIFEDFDADGDLDALMAGQRIASKSWPAGTHGSATPDTVVLVNDGTGAFGYDFSGNPSSLVDDARVDINGRTAQQPGIADRAVAGDLDGDGDIDAVIHLFQLGGGNPTPTITAANGFPLPIDQYSFGWRYLENIVNETPASGFWFRDVAPQKMKNPTGVFDPNWNRGLGMTLLADFDNNGSLDLYTTLGFAKTSSEVTTVDQTLDLIFMNAIGSDALGVMTERSAIILPPPCQDVVVEFLGETPFVSCGSFGIAQGDIDNDGDADVAVTHYSQAGRTNYPWLLVNRLNEAARSFTDEFQTRAPIGSFSDVIHTPDTDAAGNPTTDMDYAMFPALFDIDGDGDLDLIYQVVLDIPRVLKNLGTDTNGDGWITPADGPGLGTFVDVTDTAIGWIKPTTDSQDIAVVDIDLDGDLDFVNDPFSDLVTIWHNERPVDPVRPALTAAWPRSGAIRGQTIRLEGVHLNNIESVEFRFGSNTLPQQVVFSEVTGSMGTRLDVAIPLSGSVGLAQIRVLRIVPNAVPLTAPGIPGTDPVGTDVWSTQYFGYSVLQEAPALAGDMNNDGLVSLEDIADFVSALLGNTLPPGHINRSDMNGDGQGNGDDVQQFVLAVIGP